MQFWRRTVRGLARRAEETAARLYASERGDVPGWVLVTLMTAGLVAGLWVVAGPALENLFVDAISDVRP